MITTNLFVLSTVAVFAVAFIAIRKNIQQKTRIAIHKNLKKIVKLPLQKASSITPASLGKPIIKNRKKAAKKNVLKQKQFTYKIIKKPVVKISTAPVRIEKVVIKLEKIKNAAVTLPSDTELTHKDVVSLSGFKVERPTITKWIAFYDDYSKRKPIEIIADKVKTTQSKLASSKKVEKEEIEVVNIKSLIEIPRLEDLNLGYDSVSRAQYLEEYKTEIKNKVSKKLKSKLKVTTHAAVKKGTESQPKAIKKLEEDKKEVRNRSKEEARKEKKEKLASTTGSISNFKKEKQEQEKLDVINADYSLNTQDAFNKNKPLDSQQVWFNLADYQQSKEVKSVGRSPAIVESDNNEKEDDKSEGITHGKNKETKIEDKLNIRESAVVEVPGIDTKDRELIESETQSTQEQELADTLNKEVESELGKKHEALDSIIEQMNDKFADSSSVITTNKQERAVTNPVDKKSLNFNTLRNKETPASRPALASSTQIAKDAYKVDEAIQQKSGDQSTEHIVQQLGRGATPAEAQQSLKTLQSALAKKPDDDIKQKEVAVVHKLNKPMKSSLKINVNSVQLNKIVSKKQTNFDIRFYDSFYDVYSDHGTASVIIKTKLNNRMSVRSANIIAHGHIPTNTDLVFEPENFEIDIPVIESTALEELLNKSKLTGRGGYVLVQLDSERLTDEVRIDKAFEKQLYLDEGFNIVEPGTSDYLYMLFVGVEPGNALVSYVTKNSEVASKIIFITENELYFDTNEFIRKSKDEFDLVENHLLGSKNLELILSQNEINLLASTKSPNKKGLNNYIYKNVLYPLGTRQYSVLKHLKDVIFIGRWNNSLIEVPSEDYIKFIMDKFKMDNIGSQCVIQVNLSKPAKRAVSTGRTIQGHMRIDKKILDTDGQIFEEMSENSSKIFIVGEQQGVINAKVSYLDGSFDYLQTYCSEDTYLVEQL